MFLKNLSGGCPPGDDSGIKAPFMVQLCYTLMLWSHLQGQRESMEDCWKEGLWCMPVVAYSTSIHIPLAETWPGDPT